MGAGAGGGEANAAKAVCNFDFPQHTSVECVSSRTLNLSWSPGRGLHYHLPGQHRQTNKQTNKQTKSQMV